MAAVITIIQLSSFERSEGLSSCDVTKNQKEFYEPGQLGGIALGYGLDDRGFESRQWLEISLHHRVSGPPSLLYNGQQGLFLWG
jgi:hypothetical protein